MAVHHLAGFDLTSSTASADHFHRFDGKTVLLELQIPASLTMRRAQGACYSPENW